MGLGGWDLKELYGLLAIALLGVPREPMSKQWP